MLCGRCDGQHVSPAGAAVCQRSGCQRQPEEDEARLESLGNLAVALSSYRSAGARWVSGNRDHSVVFSPLSDVAYSPLLKLMLCLTDHYVKGARTSVCLSDLRCILVLPTAFRVSVAPLTQPVDS